MDAKVDKIFYPPNSKLISLAISCDEDHGTGVGRSVKNPGLVFRQQSVSWSFPGSHPGREEEEWRVTV